jgi:large subunit ribosomal protein L16
MKMPKRVKFRKAHRGRLKGHANKGNYVAFGEFGLQCLDRGFLTARQIEAGRVAASHSVAGEGRIWIRIFPWKPMSAKPAEVRMGTGKGDVEYWCAPVKEGTILFEVGGIPEDAARVAFNKVAHKLPIATRMVRRRHKLS